MDLFSSDLIQTSVTNDDFWKHFQVVPSEGDGHCLIYSLVHSYNTQPSVDLELDHVILLQMLSKHTISQRQKYSIATNGSVKDLLYQLDNYIYRKEYNSDFGDIVPDVLAEALNVIICIIEDDISPRVYTIKGSTTPRSIIYLQKVGDHYNSIEPCPPTNEPQMPHHVLNPSNTSTYTYHTATNTSTTSSSSNPIDKSKYKTIPMSTSHVPEEGTVFRPPSTLDKKFVTNHGLRVLHINCRSFLPKKDEIMWITLSSNIDVLCLTETWLNETTSNAEILFDGYTLLRKDRIDKGGGGVAIYIKQSLQFIERPNIISDNMLEMLWAEIILKDSKDNFLVSCLYRPPNAPPIYYNAIIDSLQLACNEDKPFMVLGDLNINYQLDENLHSNHIYMMEQLFSLTQLITDPTRVTNHSSTLIDVILTTCPSKHLTSGVYESNLSDHYMVYTEVNILPEKRPHKEVRFRNYNHFNTESFLHECHMLHEELFIDSKSSHLKYQTPSDKLEFLWNKWKNTFVQLSDKHAPFKITRMKQRQNKWITPDILQEIYKRDHLHKKAVKSSVSNRENTFWLEYRKQRNHVTKIINKAKLDYYTDITDAYKTKPRKFWKEIKAVIPSKSTEALNDISPDAFNEFFANIGKKVADTLPSSDEYTCPLQDSLHAFRFREVDNLIVKKIILSLPKDSKNDIFNIDTKLLSIAVDIISPFITKLINLSFEYGYCPTDWKLARVTPAFKAKGDENDKNNYRPLSVIGHIAMLIEKCAQKQLMEYLLDHRFINIDQFAYLSKHSTQTCLHRLIDDVLENINEKEITALCFLDIKKCFDTIDHSILLTKLHKYGIRDNELNWFKSYLHERKQVVICKSKASTERELKIGVPQGTVLGPLLFLLFVNDLSNVITNASINIYADDVVVYSSHSSRDILQEQMQSVMNNVNNWYRQNRLNLSLDKCNTMVISNNSRTPIRDFHLYLGNTLLKQIPSTKYLGLIIDEKLKWHEHVLSVVKKININNAKLRRLAKILPFELRRKIHNSFSVPCIDYSATVWGNFSQKNTLLINRVEHMAARAITRNYDFINTRGADLMKQVNLPTFKERFQYNTSLLMYKAVNNDVPDYIANKITFNADINQYNLRSSSNNSLLLPLPKCEIYKKSLSYSGPMTWNTLSEPIRFSTSIGSFKTQYKKLYFK